MNALHGGKAKHDKLDAQQIAVWLRGGMRPQADVYPAATRATRDLRRRRRHLMRQRAELRAHIQKPNSQSNLPEIGQKIAYNATRDGVAERFPELAGQKRIAVELALIGHYDRWLRDMALSGRKTARHHAAHPLYLRRTLPGRGERLSPVLLDDIHDSQRFPRGHDWVAYCRLVKGAKASAGKRYGTSGTTMGHASRKWAFSEAAVLVVRAKPAGQQDLARWENKHTTGNAVTVLAHTLARAVYYMVKRHTAFDMPTFLRG
jgi:transposase